MKRFIITEEEKNHIKGLYEQPLKVNAKDLSTNPQVDAAKSGITGASRKSQTIPLSPQKISEFLGYAKSAQVLDRDSNGKKNQDAIEKAQYFCSNNRTVMFSNQNYTQPKVEGEFDNSAKVYPLILTIMDDLSGLGSGLAGLSDDALGELSDLTLGIFDKDKNKEQYLKIQTVCTFLNEFKNKSGRSFSDEVYEDIAMDLGERHNSWQDTGESLFRNIIY